MGGEKRQTAIMSLMPWIVSSPIFMMRLLTVLADGIWRPGRRWVYSRRRRNSGFSVASKGWSAATIHSWRYWSNCCWLNALPCVKEEKSVSTWKGECIGITYLGLLCLAMEKIYNSCGCLFELVQVSGSLRGVQYSAPWGDCNFIRCRRFISVFEQNIKSVHGRETILDMAN